MQSLTIIGMGPGNPKYVLPVACEELRKAPVIATSYRLQETIKALDIDVEDKTFIPIGSGHSLKESTDYIKQILVNSPVTVAVSGDTGLFSLLPYLKKAFSKSQIKVYPGISSLQYLFSKLATDYQNVQFKSLHGRDCEIEELVKRGISLALLTDKEKGVAYIANILQKCGYMKRFCVAERLSYPDERIRWVLPEEAAVLKTDLMTVVFIPGAVDDF